jgi:outer membrane protein TolC
LRLSGSLGFETAHAEDLLDWQSRLWALVGGLTAPLLDGGRLRGQVEIERAQVRRAAAAYEQAVLTAYRDTADSMQALHFLARQREAAAAGRDAAGRALVLSRDRHAGGFVSYLEVVDSERAQLAAELSIVRIDAQRQSATVDLIRALGIP